MKLNLLFFAFLLISLNAYSQGSIGLVAHWNFSGNANDVSGNNLNGVVTGAVLTSGYAGTANTAYSFNGSGNRIDVAYNSIMNLDSFSICALIKVSGYYSGTCQGNYILSKGPNYNNDYYGLYFFDNAYDQNCSIYTPSHEVFTTAGPGTSGPSLATWYQSNPIMDSGVWYCVTSTYANDTLKLYVDGVLIKAVYSFNSFSPGNNPIGIGYMEGLPAYPYWFNGVIDDIRLYSRPLSSSEVTTYCDSAKIGGVDTVSINKPFIDTLFCVGDTFSLNYSANIAFLSGNTFTAQLSNSSGLFTSPVNIGSLSSTTSGAILCTIPLGTTASSNYRIRITGSNPVYISNDAPLYIHLLSVPSHHLGSNSPLCAGSVLHLGDTALTVASYSWIGPNGFNSIQQNPTLSNVVLPDSGMYYVRDSFQNGCKVTDSILVNIKQRPSIPLISTNSPICAGNTLNISATDSTSGVGYQWSGPNSFNSSNQNISFPNVLSSITGTYTVLVTAPNSCTVSSSASVVVNPNPANLSITSNSPVCSGNTLTISVNSTSTNISYSWNGPNSYNSTLQTINISNVIFADSGKYIVTATVNGCSVLDSTFVNVRPTPATPVATSNSPICAGDSLIFSATDATNGVSYSWSGPNAYSSALQNPVILNTPTHDSGKYYVKAILNGCSSKTDTIHVIVNPGVVPSVNITSMPLVPLVSYSDTFTAHVTNGGSLTTYQWYNNGFPIGGATANTIIFTMDNGIQLCVVIHSNALCASPDTASSCVEPESVNNITASNGSLDVYPNPNTGSFTIRGKMANGNIADIEVINVIGQPLFDDNVVIQNGEFEKKIFMGNAATGIYFIRVKTENWNEVIRFSVE